MGSGKSQASGGLGWEGAYLIDKWMRHTGNLREALVEQFETAVSGETPPGSIPIIARAEEAQRRATSQTLRETETSLAQTGLGGTPFGEQIMAKTRQEGAYQLGQIAPQYLQQLMSMGTGYATGQAQALIGTIPAFRQSGSSSKSWQI